MTSATRSGSSGSGSAGSSEDQGMNPYTGLPVGDPVPHASPEQVEDVCRAAANSAVRLAHIPPARRAEMLRAVAAALENARAGIVALGDAETGLGTARLDSE